MNLSVFLEESEHYGAHTPYLISYMGQHRKKGLNVNLFMQNFPKDRRIMQVCNVHYYYRQGNVEDAKEAAMDIGITMLNPHEVSFYDRRIIPIGHEIVDIGEPDDPHKISRTVYGEDMVARFRSFGDQVSLKQQLLMTQHPGCRFVRGLNGTYPEYVKPLPRAYPRWLPRMAERKREEAISRIKAGPEYRATGGNETGGLPTGAALTPQLPTSSGGSSSKGKTKKRYTAKSPGSEKKGDSGIEGRLS